MSELTARTAWLVMAQRGNAVLTVNALRGFCEHHPSTPVIVVDDGSSAADLRIVQNASFPQVEIISNQPHGVTAAWNCGARAALSRGDGCGSRRDDRRGVSTGTSPAIVFLNNDTLTTGPWLDEFLTPLNRGRILCGLALRHEQEADFLPAASRLFVAGWCFGCRLRHWQAVGGFDERLRLYFSDTDFQLRIRQHCGVTTATRDDISAGLPITHLGAGTTQGIATRRSQWSADRDVFRRQWQS